MPGFRVAFAGQEQVNLPAGSAPFPSFSLGRVHVLSAGSKTKKPEEASNPFVFIHLFFPCLNCYGTPQCELLVFQRLELAGSFSVPISGIKWTSTPRSPTAPRESQDGAGGTRRDGRTRCFSVMTQFTQVFASLASFAIKIYGEEGAQLHLSAINLSWLVKTAPLFLQLVSSQEDGRKWEESRG